MAGLKDGMIREKEGLVLSIPILGHTGTIYKQFIQHHRRKWPFKWNYLNVGDIADADPYPYLEYGSWSRGSNPLWLWNKVSWNQTCFIFTFSAFFYKQNASVENCPKSGLRILIIKSEELIPEPHLSQNPGDFEAQHGPWRAWKLTMEAWRLKIEHWSVCRPLEADSHYLHEDPYPALKCKAWSGYELEWIAGSGSAFKWCGSPTLFKITQKSISHGFWKKAAFSASEPGFGSKLFTEYWLCYRRLKTNADAWPVSL
jgi:hypothetical protein